MIDVVGERMVSYKTPRAENEFVRIVAKIT
jgi:hypothetical protein